MYNPDRELWSILSDIFEDVDEGVSIHLNKEKDNQYVVEIHKMSWSLSKAQECGWAKGFETTSRSVIVDINTINNITGIYKLIEEIKELMFDL